MKKYGVGIVGYGWVATAHISAINATPLGRVTAVCSSRKLDAVISHQAVFAADRSAELGRPVKMSELNHYAK
jgi:predicted dehydrogenase